MADGTEIEGIVFGNHNILMTHAHSHPVGSTLLDFEMENFVISSFL
jgi:hypothetical protein